MGVGIMVNRLCLGHACMGSYSCFGEAEEGIDEEGEHALYIKETKFDTCVKCATIQECPPEESTIFILSPDGKENPEGLALPSGEEENDKTD